VELSVIFQRNQNYRGEVTVRGSSFLWKCRAYPTIYYTKISIFIRIMSDYLSPFHFFFVAVVYFFPVPAAVYSCVASAVV